MIGVLNAYENNIYSKIGAIKQVTLMEEFFFRGMVFSYEDYLTFGAAETKSILVDPTAFIPLGAGKKIRIPFNPLIAYSVSGPIRIQFYTGSLSDDDGTILQGSNRDSTFIKKLLPDTVLRLNPSNLSKGSRFAGDLIPASESGPASLNLSNAANTPSLPFAISNLNKYCMDFTNDNGEAVLVEIKLTWVEVIPEEI